MIQRSRNRVVRVASRPRDSEENYINDVRLEGGFTLVFKYQLYSFGQKTFADAVRNRLRISVDCPSRIADGTVQRLLKWHLKSVEKEPE